MSRFAALALALLISLTCLLPAAAQAPVRVDALGGTTWQSEAGVMYHFTAAAELFFSYTPGQTTYTRLSEGLYVSLPFSNVNGAFVLGSSSQTFTFLPDGTTLLVSPTEDGAAPLTFNRFDRTAILAGTRWQNEHGELLVFSPDGEMFSSPVTGQCFARTSASVGAYYEMSFGPVDELYYEPDRPCALLTDGYFLYLYVSVGGQSILQQTFIPANE